MTRSVWSCYKPGVLALRCSLAAPANRDIQSSDWSGRARTLINDDIPEREANRGRRRTDVAKTGVERIIDLVKSDAAGTAWTDGCQWSPVTGWRVLERTSSNTVTADDGLGGRAHSTKRQSPPRQLAVRTM